MRYLLPLCLLLGVSVAVAWTPPTHITRGIYCPPGLLMSTGFWSPYGTAPTFAEDVAHSGRASLRATNAGGPGSGSGFSQEVKIGQTAPAPIKIAGWAKTEGVGGSGKAWTCSVYLDLTCTDGTPIYGAQAAFPAGTHDWEYSETILKPEKPVASARVYAFLRDQPGTAYFDDLFVGPEGGPNLLKNPGFEPGDRSDVEGRKQFLATLKDLNLNAVHTYLSGDVRYWQGTDGQGNALVRDLLKTAADHGLGVWLTLGHPALPTFKTAEDPNFPQYECVNGPWGQRWTESLAAAAAYDFAGLSLVPDEYNWLYYGLQERYAKHPDPKVVEFYQQLPAMCACPVCQDAYRRQFGAAMPELPKGTSFPQQAPAFRQYLRFRYDSTTAWIKRSAAAVQAANPRLRADSLLCVTPVCSDFWWGPGVAWDRLGETGMDFPTTDPYLLLHNYLGDSTHWYVTETAAHLTAATPKRQCGIVLEASRLRTEDRELWPVEIYGSALSAVSHGARELAWWHLSHITDQSHTTDHAPLSYACVKGVYSLLKQADPWLGGLKPYRGVALLYSRASDDWWRFYSQPQLADFLVTAVPAGLAEDARTLPRYASMAQRAVLYTLLQRGVPTDLYYLDNVVEGQLQGYDTIVVPFPLALSDGQAALLANLAQGGKTVLVLSQLGVLDEEGSPRATPALQKLAGVRELSGGLTSGPVQGTSQVHLGSETFSTAEKVTLDPKTAQPLARVAGQPAVWTSAVGKGKVVFFAGTYAWDLAVSHATKRGERTARVRPDPPNPQHVALFESALQASATAPWRPWLNPSGKDTEVTLLNNDRNDLVLLTTNWENEPAALSVRLPLVGKGQLVGYGVKAEGSCGPRQLKLARERQAFRASLKLEPQEACLWRMTR